MLAAIYLWDAFYAQILNFLFIGWVLLLAAEKCLTYMQLEISRTVGYMSLEGSCLVDWGTSGSISYRWQINNG